MVDCLKLTLPNRRVVPAIQVQRESDVIDALNALGLQRSHPVLVLIGGASKMSQADLACVKDFFIRVIAPLIDDLGGCVVDGGTDAGIMRMIGQARTEIDATFPLIGVAPIGLVQLPDISIESEKASLESLEPNHTHFVLTPGSEWGTESPWLAKTASALAGEAASTTVLVNGGAIALLDVEENIAQERAIVVISGTGRLADEIAAAVLNPEETRDALKSVLEHGDLNIFDLREPIRKLEELLRELLHSR